MSLTAFQRYRRMQQVDEMKPENIEEPKEEVIEEQPEVVEVENENEGAQQEVIEEPKPATRGRGRRA